MMTEMNAVKNRTGNGVLRRGVVLLAVLLLACTLMAGAVSAAETTAAVSTYEELIDNLSKTESAPTTITLAADIHAPAQIKVNRSVTIDGGYHAITAIIPSDGWPQDSSSGQKNLLLIHLKTGEDKISGGVFLKNIVFESNKTGNTNGKGAHGVQAYKTGDDTPITLENLVLNNSAGSGLNLNGANATVRNVTIRNSAWMQSIDVSSGSQVTYASNLTIDEKSELSDAYPIVNDKEYGIKAQVHSSLYKSYDLYYSSEESDPYSLQKRVWSKADTFCTTVPFANVSVANLTDPVALHMNLTEALTNYVDTGATVTVLKNFEHGYDYQSAAINRPTITKAVTLDLNGKTITAKATAAAKTADTAFIKINGNGAALTVKNGKITLDGPYMFYAASESNLIIESGTFTADGTIASGNGLNSDTKMIISGGELTSAGAPVVFMPSTLTLIINGTANLTGPVGVDIKTGTVTINENAKITATGTGAGATAENSNGPVDGESSAIVLERTNAYKGNLVLTIGGEAQISSTSGAAIRNYIREKDLTYKDGSPTYSTPVITVQDNAKLSGAVTLENRKYTDSQTEEVVGTFNLNAGYYKAPSYDKLLVGKPNVQYDTNHVMSDTPVKDGYYAPVEVKTPEQPATSSPDGKTVEGAQESTAAVSGDVATITQNTGAASGIKVNLTLTYPSGTSPSVSGQTITAPAAPMTVIAEYSPVNLDNTIGGFFNLIVEFSNVTNITKLPNISTTINPDAKKELEGQGLSLMSMVVVDITQMKAAGETPILTLTFTVPISKFTDKDLGSLRAYHYDGTNLKEWSAVPTRITQGTNYVFTITDITEASPWMLGARTSTPTPPTPQPVYSSGDGNMDGAYRVLFETNGGSFISPATGLSAGDKITLPAAPTKEGSSFVGWYKDAACTQAWSFSETIDGDMTLYAKWSGGSSGQAASATTVATAKPTTKATSAPAATTSQSQAAATTAAPAATTAAGVSPTLTQAPAPVFGALLGLLAAGVLLRRRE